ncbi:MAG: hypothetical protein Ta2F_02380 [Termitinemataceae bacterium]|nr:MAG: hypothetical protein Ta2F_02380 [Termitinemataceae bacterium]
MVLNRHLKKKKLLFAIVIFLIAIALINVISADDETEKNVQVDPQASQVQDLIPDEAFDYETQWYIANAAGMAIEKAFPLRALRSKNALAIKNIHPDELPAELKKYYLDPWNIVLSILYEDGKRLKTQWVFRDEAGLTLFVASISDNGSGFIEWYDDKGLIVEEQRLAEDGSGFFVSYTYKENTLIYAESHVVEAVKKEVKEEVKAETENIKDVEASSDSEQSAKISEEKIEGILENIDTKDIDKSAIKDTAKKLLSDTSQISSDMISTGISAAREAAKNAGIDIPFNEEDDEEIVKALAQGVAEFEQEEIKQGETKPIEADVLSEDALPPRNILPKEKVSQAVRNIQGPAAVPDFFVARSGREGGLLWSDNYRYTRTASLRVIERTFYVEQTNYEQKDAKHSVRFPRTIAQVNIEALEKPISAQPLDAAFLQDVLLATPSKIIYKTDNKRRVLSETREDENGEVIGEVLYNWKGDILSSVEWHSKDDDRIVEYIYNNKKERISEKDYKNNVLERTVVLEDGKEIETLFKENKAILRAVWEEGRKISEKRLSDRFKELN